MDEQHKVAFLLVVWRIPGFITSFVAACASRSLVLWLEFIENASILLPGILLLVLSERLNKNLAGLFCILIFAIRNLIGGAESGEYLFFALAVSIAGLFIDFVIVRKEHKLSTMNHSKMLHTAFVSAQKEFVFDFISIITLIIGIVYRDRSWISYFTPIVSIIVVIPFSITVIGHLKNSLIDLTDLTLDEENQLKIISILSEFYEKYDELGEVKSRMTGEKIYVDIELSFHEYMRYGEIRDTVAAMKKRVKEELGPCTVNIIIL